MWEVESELWTCRNVVECNKILAHRGNWPIIWKYWKFTSRKYRVQYMILSIWKDRNSTQEDQISAEHSTPDIYTYPYPWLAQACSQSKYSTSAPPDGANLGTYGDLRRKDHCNYWQGAHSNMIADTWLATRPGSEDVMTYWWRRQYDESVIQLSSTNTCQHYSVSCVLFFIPCQAPFISLYLLPPWAYSGLLLFTMKPRAPFQYYFLRANHAISNRLQTRYPSSSFSHLKLSTIINFSCTSVREILLMLWNSRPILLVLKHWPVFQST